MSESEITFIDDLVAMVTANGFVVTPTFEAATASAEKILLDGPLPGSRPYHQANCGTKHDPLVLQFSAYDKSKRTLTIKQIQLRDLIDSWGWRVSFERRCTTMFVARSAIPELFESNMKFEFVFFEDY